MKKLAILAIIVLSPFLLTQPVEAAQSGDLVKCPNFSTVYYLAPDGTRWVFPNEKIYFSWYENFDAVQTISCSSLATYPIGQNITYQPGVRLVKVPSIPTVYAVELGGRLSAIENETQAELIYGSNWSQRIDDLPESFWPAYTVVSPVNNYPEGSFLLSETNYFFWENESAWPVNPTWLNSIQTQAAITASAYSLNLGADLDQTEWQQINQPTYGKLDGSLVPVETTNPDALNLTTGVNLIASSESFKLDWNSINDADSYMVLESTNPDFSNPTAIYEGDNSDLTITKSVTRNTTYYYKVRLRRAGQAGPWSNVITVVVKPYKLIENVPDANQPARNTFNQSITSNWSVPMATANVLSYFDQEANNQYAQGVTGEAETKVIADYLAWLMDTSEDAGTQNGNIESGLKNFLIWDGLRPSNYDLPNFPAVLLGKKAYTGWSLPTARKGSTSQAGALQQIKNEITAGNPVVAVFDYWNPISLNQEIGAIELFDWGEFVTRAIDSAIAERAPNEEWNLADGNKRIGHAVTVVGYMLEYDANDGEGARDWVIIQDNWPTLPTLVAIPWQSWNYSLTMRPAVSIAPSTPTLSGPETALSGEIISLTWSSVTAAQRYEIEVADSSSFENTIESNTTPVGDKENTFANTHFSLTDTSFYYRLRAWNDFGASDWSKTFEIEIQSTE